MKISETSAGVQPRILAPILIADDDTDDLFFAVRLVKKTGTQHPVMTFDDGSAVMEYLSRAWLDQADAAAFPRLLFLDLKMEGLGGFAFLEWVAQHKALSSLHVIVLSGSDEPEDVERARALGAKRYLVKYPSTATFARIIHHVYGESAVSTGQTSARRSPSPFHDNGPGQQSA
ncbi:MAG TPA: response regulator [Opitutaceae bacterium]|nr:response regulator [Opitutaceae bacterium]